MNGRSARVFRSRGTYLTRVQSAAPESGAQHVARVPGLGQLWHFGTLVLAPHGHGGVPQAQRRAADLAQLAPSGHGADCPAVVASCTAQHAGPGLGSRAGPLDPSLASMKSYVYIVFHSVQFRSDRGEMRGRTATGRQTNVRQDRVQRVIFVAGGVFKGGGYRGPVPIHLI